MDTAGSYELHTDFNSVLTLPVIYSSAYKWLSQWQILSPKSSGKLQELQHSLEGRKVTGEPGTSRLLMRL